MKKRLWSLDKLGSALVLREGKPGEKRPVFPMGDFKANIEAAEFLVKAVNHHQQLVEALRDALDLLTWDETGAAEEKVYDRGMKLLRKVDPDGDGG